MTKQQMTLDAITRQNPNVKPAEVKSAQDLINELVQLGIAPVSYGLTDAFTTGSKKARTLSRAEMLPTD